MISVCYLLLSRRRRARSRWCWAPAPGGCWMWLGRERKTTKTTVWCTAKVSKRAASQHPVISLAALHTTTQQRSKDTDNSPSSPHLPVSFLSPSLLLPSSLSLCASNVLSFFFALAASQSHKQAQIIASSHLQGHTQRHPWTPSSHTISFSFIQRVIYITITLIRNWETSLDTQS